MKSSESKELSTMAPRPMKDQLWKVYEGGRLRRIYAIETDDEGAPKAELLTWLANV